MVRKVCKDYGGQSAKTTCITGSKNYCETHVNPQSNLKDAGEQMFTRSQGKENLEQLQMFSP